MSAAKGPVSRARRMAVDQLVRIEETAAYVGLAPEVDVEDAPSARDTRQAREYVSGVTRWRRWLDFLIGQFYDRGADQLEPALRQILRIALYDLLFLKTPPHAAVNEAVELTRTLVRPQAARLTNGLLRNVVRARDGLPEPEGMDPVERLAIRHSHPTWIVRRWLARFGEDDTVKLLETNNERPTFGLRINTRRTTVEAVVATLADAGAEPEESRFIPYFVRTRQLQTVAGTGLLSRGMVSVQDESAGLAVRALDPQPGERVLDLCAAPGGKALHAAQLMEDRGELLAVDVHGGRLSLVQNAARVQGVSILKTLQADARTLDPVVIGTFDRVLLDAPCSGLGVLSRRADLRWNRSGEDLTALTILQAELLASAARLVRPGGLLVYSTCSIEPEENEGQVWAFLETNHDFTVEPVDALVPEVVRTEAGFMATLPHVHGIDGAFAARLRRRS